MKRFSLFLFALFALLMGVPPQAALAKAGDVVTNLSNLSNSKVYNIKSVRGYLLYSANYTGKLAGSAGSGVKDAGTASATAAAQQFAIYTVGGKHFLYSVGAKKFVSRTAITKAPPTLSCQLQLRAMPTILGCLSSVQTPSICKQKAVMRLVA